MKYFFDTEFIENGKTIDLISIGIVADDCRCYYAQNVECDFLKASDWVWRNVFPNLAHFNMRGSRSCSQVQEPYDSGLGIRTRIPCVGKDEPCPWRDRISIKQEILAFCDFSKYGKPEFWGYYADYDWVALCQLFGTMVQLPKGYPMYCNDLKQLCVSMGDPSLPKGDGRHNSLTDALWVKGTHQYLTNRVLANP